MGIALEMDERSGWTREETHELTPFGTFLDVRNELLLALLEFCALAVEFALRLCQGALMLAQTLRWSYCAAKERFLRSIVEHVTKRIDKSDNVRQCSWLLAKPETPTEVARQRVTSIYFYLDRSFTRGPGPSPEYGLASHRRALFSPFLPRARPATDSMSL